VIRFVALPTDLDAALESPAGRMMTARARRAPLRRGGTQRFADGQAANDRKLRRVGA